MRCRPEHSPERAAEVTGIPAETIVAAGAGVWARGTRWGGPAAIRLNYGIQRSENGGTAVRAVAMLPLMTGAWQRQGRRAAAFDQRGVSVQQDALQMPELMKASPLGREARTVNMSRLGRGADGAGVIRGQRAGERGRRRVVL